MGRMTKPLSPDAAKYLREVFGYDRPEDVDLVTEGAIRENAEDSRKNGLGWVLDEECIDAIDRIPRVIRRTFEAARYPKGSPARDRLNASPVTSEYLRGSAYVLRRPALSSDGLFLPQRFHFNTYRTKAEAEANRDAWSART